MITDEPIISCAFAYSNEIFVYHVLSCTLIFVFSCIIIRETRYTIHEILGLGVLSFSTLIIVHLRDLIVATYPQVKSFWLVFALFVHIVLLSPHASGLSSQ